MIDFLRIGWNWRYVEIINQYPWLRLHNLSNHFNNHLTEKRIQFYQQKGREIWEKNPLRTAKRYDSQVLVDSQNNQNEG